MKSQSSDRKKPKRRKGVTRRRDRRRTLPEQQPDSAAVTKVHPPAVKAETQPPSAYVRIFEKLFRSFRLYLFESLGDRHGEAISRAERKISLLAPEYDRNALTDETAPLTVDVVEEIVRSASFFKRPKLRRAAVALIADLYNKQYQLLEQRSAIDRVEQVYYRLKN